MDKEKVSRRDVLNGAVSTVALGLGVSGKVAANESPESVDQIVQSPPVQRILNELSYPAVESATIQNFAGRFEQRSGDNLSTTLLSTEAGEIAYTDVSGSDDIAVAHIDADHAREVAPKSRRRGTLVLSAIGDELTRLRSANPGEVNRVKKATKRRLIDDDTALFNCGT
ncbi:MAG: hypothetical protein V5A34_02320 [Halapricum sp.]